MFAPILLHSMINPYRAPATVQEGSSRSIWNALGMLLSSLMAALSALLGGYAAYMLVRDFYEKPSFRDDHFLVFVICVIAVALFSWSATCYHAIRARRGVAIFLATLAYLAAARFVFDQLVD